VDSNHRSYDLATIQRVSSGFHSVDIPARINALARVCHSFPRRSDKKPNQTFGGQDQWPGFGSTEYGVSLK
jgi:hypothetical protein